MSERKKKIRENFRKAVFRRDNYTCRFCDRTDSIDAHHITDRNKMPNGGYVEENGITLCPQHHEIAELYHLSNGEVWEDGFHPDDLYYVIGSNYDNAFAASEKLKKV